MVDHPIGCGKPPSPDETELWEHWGIDIEEGKLGLHCEWEIENVRRGGYTCSWDVSANHTDGLFHKACLQREGYIW